MDSLPQTQPYKPSEMTSDQLRRQAELRAAASTPSGVLRQPLSDKSLLNFAQEEILSKELDQEALKQQDLENQATQAELQKLGLKPSQVNQPNNSFVDDSQVVSRQLPQAADANRSISGTKATDSDQYSNLILSSLKDQQTAADKSLAATDLLMKEYEISQLKRAEDEQIALKDAQKKIDETNQATKNFQWDNRSVWEKSSTGQKIALAIGGFLSSLSDSGSKAFRDSIYNSMNNDLEQQKEKYNLLKQQGKDYQSFYGDLVKKFGDEKAADLQMTNIKLNAINNKLKVMSETAQSKIVASKALQGIDLVNSEIAKNQATLIAQITAKAKDAIPGYVNTIEDKTDRAKFQQALSSKFTLDSTLKDLETIVKGSGESIPFTTKNVRAKQLVQDAQLQMKEIKKLGVLSGDDARRLDDYISAPSMFKSDALMIEQIKGMKDLANKAITGMEKAYGIQREGSNIGRLK